MLEVLVTALPQSPATIPYKEACQASNFSCSLGLQPSNEISDDNIGQNKQERSNKLYDCYYL
jgi:hypothetical protein